MNMKKKIIIVGAGGHAAELREYIDLHNQARPADRMTVLGLIDDDRSNYAHYEYHDPYLGDIQSHSVDKSCEYLMAIANLKYRRPLIERFLSAGATFTGLIHPTALIASTAEIGEGVVISHNASLGPKVKIGDFNMLNSRCTIGHDTVLGKYNFISPQVALSGNTTVGEGNLIGTNAATIPGVTIGNNSIVGAGAVVIKDVPDGVVVVGNKARILEKK